MAGDTAAASFVGVPQAVLAEAGIASEAALTSLRPLVEKAALTQAINDAWVMVAILTAMALPLIPFARPARDDSLPMH